MCKLAGIVIGIFVVSTTVGTAPALADRCDADAKAEQFWETEPGFKFKVKFRAQSQFCDRYACSGFIHFTSHYSYVSGRGGSNRWSHIVAYRIPKGQTSVDVVEEIVPGAGAGALDKIKLNAIEVGAVSCQTP
jgi:hypothetical protein